MDRPLCGAPPFPDPTVAPGSQEPTAHSENAELLGCDPSRLSSGTSMASFDHLSACTSGTPTQSVQELSVLPDAFSASASASEVSAERAQKTSNACPSKKTHHTSAGENRASLQKPFQSNRLSTQKVVQWVRVLQKSGNAFTQETGSTHETGYSERKGSSVSSSTVVPQNQAPLFAEPLQQAALSPVVISGEQNTKVSDEDETRSFTEVLGKVKSLPLVSSKSSHDQNMVMSVIDETIAQDVIEDSRVPGVGAEEVETSDFLCQAVEDNDLSGSSLYQAVEEHSMPSTENTSFVEDGQVSEPQQRSLSRTSSLSAKAREFIPKSVTTPTSVSTVPAQPPQPPQMQGPVMPPLMIPLNTGPGILSMYPQSSAMPSPQLGGFAIPMAGPPPPPIPASLMGPMPVLVHPHSGLLNVGPPPPPVIPSSPYLIHSPSTSVPPHLPLAPLVDSLIDPAANQSANPSGEVVQDQYQSQDSDPSATQPGTIKPVLTEELKAKIVKQVEFYFSDTNLPTDHHLMKFVKKDPEGFVPIAIVANFRKVRSLMKNYALVATALRSSKQLVVSSDGKKVRRLHSLPHMDLEEIQSRTVVAENLPSDHSIESLEQIFASAGNVKMIRVCEPEASNGANQTSAKFSKADMIVSNKLHALVEYETVEQAERAVAELTDQGNWRRGLHVRLLLRRTNKHAAFKSQKVNEGADGSGPEDDATPSSGDNVVEKVGEEGQERSEEHVGGDNLQPDGLPKKGRGRGRGRSSNRGRGQYHPNGGRSNPVGTPPQANSLSNFELKLPLGPRMPDGTRGFTLGRGKIMPTNNLM